MKKSDIEDIQVDLSVAAKKLPLAWGLVVCFHPDKKLLLDLLVRLSPQVEAILILNNGGISPDVRLDALRLKNIKIFDFNENVGIAVALNEGFAQASAQGVDFIVTFDQDSLPVQNHVEKLVYKWRELDSDRNLCVKVGAIGPSFYDVRKKRVDYPFYRASGFRIIREYFAGKDTVPVDALITSGMLVPVRMWADGLKFMDKLFIDFVDTEWCFRSRSMGYMHYGSFDVKMRHEISDVAPRVIFGLIVLGYSPIRRYYHFRNCLYLVSRSYVPLPFRFRLIFGLGLRVVAALVIDVKPRESFKAICMGVFDALRARFGKKAS